MPVHYIESDIRITWTEIGKANTGVITINPNGTYRWNTDSPQGIIDGKWRVANEVEMDDQGGAGIVLEKAKSGDDWVAFKYRASNPNEEWLGICQVFQRANREGAIRIPPGKEGEVKVVPRK